MRKSLSFIVLMVLLLVLSGCDLISPDVLDKASEELCRENPEHELCQIEDFAQVENDIVLGLFNDVIENYTNTEDTEFCENLFSITNIELLDKCREDRNSLVPENFDNYVAIDVTKDGDYYVIRTENPLTFEVIDFRVRIVLEGTTHFIDDWQTEMVSMQLRGIEKAEIKRGLAMFIEDFSNPDITDEALCTEWYDGKDNDCDGIEDARRRFKAGADLAKIINVLDDDDDDDGLIYATFEFENNGHFTVLKIAFTATNETGELKLVVFEGDVLLEGMEEKDINEALQLFINDFENPEITDEELCSIWYDGLDDDCDGIEEDRRKFKAGAALAKAINVLDDDEFGDSLLEAEITFDLDGHFTVLKISFLVTTSDGVIDIKIIEGDVEGEYGIYLPAVETLEIMNMFINDYLDSTIPFEELNDMYFDNEMDEAYSQQRLLDQESGIVISVLSEGEVIPNEEGFFTIEIEIIHNGITRYEEVSIKPIRIDLARVDINFQEYEDEYLNIDELEELFKQFITDYLDPDSDDDTLDEMYFGGTMDLGFFEQRLLDLEKGISVTFVEISGNSKWYDPFFEITIEITDDGTVTREKIKVLAKRVDKSSPLLFIDNSGNTNDEVDYNEVRNHITNFLDAINDATIDATLICPLYVDEMSQNTCTELVTQIREGGKTVFEDDLTGDNNLYRIYLKIEGISGQVVNREYDFVFYYDKGILMVSILPVDETT